MSTSLSTAHRKLLEKATAEARVLKLGRTLSVGDVFLVSDGVEGPVARAGLTYAIPPRSGGSASPGSAATQNTSNS